MDVRDKVLHGTLLNQRSTYNRKRIWTSVQTRYLVEGADWLTALLVEKSVQGSHDPEFVALLYLLYALRDRLTYDVITQVLCSKSPDGRAVVSRNDVLDLLNHAAAQQPQIERWSEATRIKLAGSILTALRDFGVLQGKQKKVLLQPPLPLSAAAALVRLLVAEGRRGKQVLQDSTWRLFLLSEANVSQVLGKLAQAGVIRFEKAGSTVVLETPPEWECVA